jgi:hypothetical protein
VSWVAVVVVLVVLALPVVYAVIRLWWRLVYKNEPLDSAGSWGKALRKSKDPDA